MQQADRRTVRGRRDHQRPPQLLPGRGSRFVYDDLPHRGVLDLVRCYPPDIADSVRATLNFNLPGSVAQHYHIDGVYLKEFLICNVAVVDTDSSERRHRRAAGHEP